MAYDPQRSRPRQSVSDDETAPVDAILDEIAEEAEADAAEQAGMADVVSALVDEIVEDEAIIDALASQPTTVEVTEIVEVEEQIIAVIDGRAGSSGGGLPAGRDLPGGVEIEVRDDEIVVHTPGADVEVAASGTDVIVHTDDADVDVNSGDDVVVVSTADDEIIVDVSPAARGGSLSDRSPAEGTSGRRRPAVIAAVVVVAVGIAVWLRRRRRRSTD